MDELRKEKNRLALEKIELLDKISSYESRDDLSRDDKNDALEELRERLEVLEEELVKARQTYNAEVSKANHKEKSLEYEQMRNRRASQAKYEEGQAKYEQMRNDRKAEEDMILSFMSENESARNEFMRGATIEDIHKRHAGEIEAFKKKKNDSVDVDIDIDVDTNNNTDTEEVSVQSNPIQNADDPYSYIRAKYGLDDSVSKEEIDQMLAGIVDPNANNSEVENNVVAGERPVFPDPDNPEIVAVNEQSDTGKVNITPEISEEEMVEPKMGLNQAVVSNDTSSLTQNAGSVTNQVESISTLTEKAKPYFDKVADTSRRLVTKISSNITLGKAAVAMAVGAGAILFAPLGVAALGTAVSALGSTALIGGMGAASHEFMKGKKL